LSSVRHNDVIYASVRAITKIVAVANCGQVGQEPATTDNDNGQRQMAYATRTTIELQHYFAAVEANKS